MTESITRSASGGAGKPGPRNAITDIAGISVGNAQDPGIRTGVTALICDRPAVAACHVMGGAPGTRDTELLNPENTVESVDAIVLSGGSAFGLDAAGGVQASLREQGRGFEVAGQRVPIVPGAILFDLVNGGDKDWGRYPPYRELGYEAAQNASLDFATGTAGAGTGALVAGLKGGLGTASAVLPGGVTIAALVAVNAVGSPVMADTGHFWAAPFERNGEFGGLGLPASLPRGIDSVPLKFREAMTAGANTTIGIIATNAKLDKAGARRLAISAHDGYARALWPVHTPLDGDLVFSLATGSLPAPSSAVEWIDICASASAVMARAIARAIHDATPEEGDTYPAWAARYRQLRRGKDG